jgi:anthranilate phosphoribosyltransferase
MKQILTSLFEHQTLSKEQAKSALHEITAGKCNESEMAAFLTVFCMRPITVDELSGFRETLQELCLQVDLGTPNILDMCGTGGDGKHTFNISTLASFVAAGAGIKIAKHGNYGVSSGCGSSNVIEALGYTFSNDQEVLKATMQRAGICFMHAQLFHPAMKNVAPIRRALGVKTFFNMLGPIINPAFPKKQVTGVYSKEVARLYKYVLEKTAQDFIILYSLDGYDEISLTSPFIMISKDKEEIIYPADLGFPTYALKDIAGGESVEESTKIFTSVLEGKGTRAQNDVVIVNAAMGIKCSNPTLSLKHSIEIARESLMTGKAMETLHLFLGK